MTKLKKQILHYRTKRGMQGGLAQSEICFERRRFIRHPLGQSGLNLMQNKSNLQQASRQRNPRLTPRQGTTEISDPQECLKLSLQQARPECLKLGNKAEEPSNQAVGMGSSRICTRFLGANRGRPGKGPGPQTSDMPSNIRETASRPVFR